jgi:hypothetical protein
VSIHPWNFPLARPSAARIRSSDSNAEKHKPPCRHHRRAKRSDHPWLPFHRTRLSLPKTVFVVGEAIFVHTSSVQGVMKVPAAFKLRPLFQRQKNCVPFSTPPFPYSHSPTTGEDQTMSSKHVLAVLVLLTGLSSCVPVPLGDPEKSTVPKEYVGLWLWDETNQVYLFDVQPFDSRACIVDWMVVDKKTGKADRRYLVKAWTTDIKGTRFLSLKALRADAANNPSQSGDALTMGKLELKEGQLSLHLLKTDAFKGIRTPAQLHKVLEKRHKEAAIYGGTLKMKRVKTSDETAMKILKAFHRQ